MTAKRKSKSAYAGAGVDIELGNQVKSDLPALLASTHRAEVLGEVGGFGGLFALNTRRHKNPVLVSSVDGVGTKLKVAFSARRHDTIGRDLVNHCVNDIVVLGAEPLFFLDYLGTGKLKPEVFQDIVRGFAEGCRENGCALIGGETAQMPGFYQPGEYDVSGTIVGVVDRERMIRGTHVKPGDVVIGLESNGLHTNGYSLARKVLLETLGWKISRKVPALGCTVGEELLRVHRSYAPLVLKLEKALNKDLSRPGLKAVAHITGGGFVDNIPRSLPKDCDVVIDPGSWTPQPVFQIIQEAGKVSFEEMHQVFNMGVGMTLIVSAAASKRVLKAAASAGCPAWVIGGVESGSGVVRWK